MLTETIKTYFSLEELIKWLENEDPNTVLKVGFAKPHSYRGYYDQLAFEPTHAQKVSEALEVVKPCLDKVFEGYKGGDFKMYGFTDCWLAEYGSSGGQQIGHLLMELLKV